MQSEFKKFDELPSELKISSAQNLSNSHLVSLAQTSKYHFALFKPVIATRKLLHHVTRGDHNAVEVVLKQNIHIIFKRGKVTDCSGREFEYISGFEYALWALDKHMWEKIMLCVPQNQEGKRLVELLIAQYNQVNTLGITYKLNGKTVTEHHFDFKNTIIRALQTQVNAINRFAAKDWEAIGKQWREDVGGAQKQLPVHIVNEYCSSERFYPIPKFISKPISSTQFYNFLTHKDEAWFGIGSRLAVDFAIYKGDGECYANRESCVPFCNLSGDLAAITALYELRTLNFTHLEAQLKAQLNLNNHGQLSPMGHN